MTATPARIRRIVREEEYAVATDATILAARGDAQDGGNKVMFSFFDNVADAQTVLNERFTFMKTNRRHEAAEVDGLLSIGTSIPIVPVIPKARMIDDTRPLDFTGLIKGLAVDFNTDRNSVEVDG